MMDETAMELVHERPIALRDDEGTVYDLARVYAVAQSDGRWGGFIEFVPADASDSVRSPRETTQRSVQDVAYWATGLELVYFEGALDRGLRAPARTADAPIAVAASTRVRRTARLEVESADPALPLRLMGTRTLVPGQRRRIQDVAALVYEGTLRSPSPAERGLYAFVAEFTSDNAAALLANVVWSELHGTAARIVVEGTPITLDHAALKGTLLDAAA
jgi:hypothetical protein